MAPQSREDIGKLISARLEKTRSTAHALGDDEATVQWKIDMTVVALTRELNEQRVSEVRKSNAKYLTERIEAAKAKFSGPELIKELSVLDDARIILEREMDEDVASTTRLASEAKKKAIDDYQRNKRSFLTRVGIFFDSIERHPIFRRFLLAAIAFMGPGVALLFQEKARHDPSGLWFPITLGVIGYFVCGWFVSHEIDEVWGIARPKPNAKWKRRDFYGFPIGIRDILRIIALFPPTAAAVYFGLAIAPSVVDSVTELLAGVLPARANFGLIRVGLTAACVAFSLLGIWWLCVKVATRTKGGARISSLVGGAAEVATRGKIIVVGLWFGFCGLMFLAFSISPLTQALSNPGARLEDYILPAAGTAIGLYLLLARGLGPIWGALSWSRLSADSHGQARFATPNDLRRAKLMPREGGAYLGEWPIRRHKGDEVGYPGSVHLITIGPNGSGKGTGIIVPNLATLQRSILIIDPKGEAAAITARAREKFGSVKIINPFNVLADTLPHLRSGGFNPLAVLDPTHDNFVDDCVGIAQALVKEHEGKDAFFAGSAQDLVTALVMYEKLRNGRDATLGNVRTMLTEPYAQDAGGQPVGLAKTIIAMTQSDYEPLRSKAGRFKVGGKSVLDIISTANNETKLLDSPALKRDLAGEAIDWDSMKDYITTVYLILPSDRLESHANFLRLVVTSALRTLLRSPPGAVLPPVLFMLDEFAQLGYLPPIENAMGIARGFGVQLWPFLQDLNQLHALYKDRWQTFIGARGVLTAFAPQDMFTADYLSRLCGGKTVIVESENMRPDLGIPGGGRAPQGQPLIRPEELMAMPAGQMLCFAAPCKYPFFTSSPGYWERSLAEGLDPNPYYHRS
jgi:type IV secretion system protein VirD4